MNLSSQTDVTPNKKQRRGTLCLQLNPKESMGGDEGLEPPSHDDKNGII